MRNSRLRLIRHRLAGWLVKLAMRVEPEPFAIRIGTTKALSNEFPGCHEVGADAMGEYIKRVGEERLRAKQSTDGQL